MSVTVLKGGMLTTVQDLGRTGHQRYGVAVGGAADPLAARLANLLVGNNENAAVLEISLAGPELRLDADALVAWCGADFDPQIASGSLPANRPVRVERRAVIKFGPARAGARAWMAIAGGFEVPLVLGSRSTCLRSGIGGYQGRAVVAGDVLPVGVPSDWANRVSESLRSLRRVCCDWSVRLDSLGPAGKTGRLRVLPGPEWSWFGAETRARFFASTYHVTKEADRMGVRLEGAPLELERPREMISSAVNAGVVQVPPGGQPIVLLADRQTVGGYPRIGAVAAVDDTRLAQLKQGDVVGFDEISLREAHELVLARERVFSEARKAIARRLG